MLDDMSMRARTRFEEHLGPCGPDTPCVGFACCPVATSFRPSPLVIRLCPSAIVPVARVASTGPPRADPQTSSAALRLVPNHNSRRSPSPASATALRSFAVWRADDMSRPILREPHCVVDVTDSCPFAQAKYLISNQYKRFFACIVTKFHDEHMVRSPSRPQLISNRYHNRQFPTPGRRGCCHAEVPHRRNSSLFQ